MMIAFSTIQNQHALFCSATRLGAENRRSSRILTLCTNNNPESESESDDQSQNEGDIRQQEMLARIAMLQTEKLRLTGYLDNKADYLTQFAEQAKTELDKIAEDALKELEESNAKQLEDIETQMQAFEESAQLSRDEIEQSDRNLADFEDQVEKDRNEGLFFKSLGKPKTAGDVEEAKANAKEEIKKIEEVTKQSAGSETRRNVYLGFIGIVAIGLADCFVASPPDWRKVAVLGAILVPLITQFANEQEMISESEKEKEGGEEKNK